MTDEELLHTVRTALGRYTDIPSDKIKPPIALAELGIDSLTAVGVVTDLEETLGISIPNDEALEVQTVGDVIERLRRHLDGGSIGDTPAPA